MYLRELELGKKTKCVCESCKGTGIFKGFAEKDDLGVICWNCNGKGYYTLKLNDRVQLVQDEKTGIVYEVKEGHIWCEVELFTKLQKRDDVNYVVYSTSRVFSPEYLFEHGASEINVITYKEFLKGEYPLPMMEYTCPRYLSQLYGHADFDNNCNIGTFESCRKYGSKECWNKFYGDAKTVKEKQKVMKKIK